MIERRFPVCSPSIPSSLSSSSPLVRIEGPERYLLRRRHHRQNEMRWLDDKEIYSLNPGCLKDIRSIPIISQTLDNLQYGSNRVPNN